MSRAKCIMVQGTMSGAGKSLLCTALCRIFTEDGFRTAPFKSQNMALNSFVTADGLEMGRAQVVQAEAAGREPDVRMNPVLLKPCTDTGSQVIVNGKVRGQMEAADYFAYKKELIPEILADYNSLAAENDIIVIEGAGSPAEINLRKDDIVNMGLAELVDAPVLLAGDIDRGGVFAQLYGTVELLSPPERERVKGLIINKFRGSVDLLTPGLTTLEELTGIPVLGVVPYLPVELDEEDSLAPQLAKTASRNSAGTASRKPLDAAVIRLPRLSNFTDFAPLLEHSVLGMRYVGKCDELGHPDLVILPGTKSTISDLLWLRRTGLEAAVLRLHGEGVPVLGICGGYQMMGESLSDPAGTDGGGTVRGMGLLPTATVFGTQKVRTRVDAVTGPAAFSGTLEGVRLSGYEIHTGVTTVRGAPFCTVSTPAQHADGCVSGTAMGTYLHGLFDTGGLTERLAAVLCRRKGIPYEEAEPVGRGAFQERQFQLLADGVRKALDMQKIYEMTGEDV